MGFVLKESSCLLAEGRRAVVVEWNSSPDGKGKWEGEARSFGAALTLQQQQLGRSARGRRGRERKTPSPPIKVKQAEDEARSSSGRSAVQSSLPMASAMEAMSCGVVGTRAGDDGGGGAGGLR